MNTKLLLEIFKIPSMSHHEEVMANFIKDKLDEYGILYKQDSSGNIYNTTHDNKPLLCSHIDTVQDEHDTLLTDFIKIRNNYISGYGVIGGDDKCGIYIILETLKDRKDINFLFCVQEEIGGAGSADWILGRRLDNILYGLVLDRTGNSDIICTRNDYGVKEFEVFLHEIGKGFGYSPASGMFSDADRLNELISCANLSVGYYSAHSKQEFVSLIDLENAYKFVNTIISHVGEKFEKPTISKAKWQSYRNGVWYEDDDIYPISSSNYWKRAAKEERANDILDSGYGMTMTDIECACCGVQTKTHYFASIQDFLCQSCIQVLKNEIEEAEEEINMSEAEEACWNL